MSVQPKRHRLSERQAFILNRLRQWDNDPHGVLVGGRDYQTAEALERRGLVSIRLQGPSLGWVTVTSAGREHPTNI